MTLSYTQLLVDLHTAYLDARRHKRSRKYQLEFESNLFQNLESIANQLFTRTYSPRPSECFIIEDPKKREVFAAEFRDRIVHHLYYNYTHAMFERTFIADTYSCIRGRGTHYGISRLESHIRQESLNYTEKVYILKMDISGYFMHINRLFLLDICRQTLAKMRFRPISKYDTETWNDRIDFDFVLYLSEVIIMLDPTRGCVMRGRKADWNNLDYNKSLFHSPQGCGLPIGNLTSQLFSNIYLSVFDNYMKRTLKCRRYGRYVDDFYVVSNSKERLHKIIPLAASFLSIRLGLGINQGKTIIRDSFSGVEFLGAYLKPHRRYVSNRSLSRILRKIPSVLASTDPAQINSYLGILSHYNAYRITKRLFFPLHYKRGYFTKGMKKYVELTGK